MLFCPAALPLSRQTLTYTAGIIRRHRRQIGSPWRKLNPGRQALLVLAYLRKGDTFAELAAVVGISTATAWRYVTETVALLAARSPKLRQVLRDAKHAGHAYLVIDGTLIPIDRVAADRPFCSGKHRRHGMNMQVIASPDGDIVWVSGPLPGAVHDLTAARIWGIVRELAASGLVVPGDKGYLSEDDIRTPYRGRNKPASQKDANRAHARLRQAHTVVVVMENHSYAEIMGNPTAPFISTLAVHGALFTGSYAITHPSQPNYLALFSGGTQGVTDDSCPNQFTAPNLAAGLRAAGKSFSGYAEDLPGPGSRVCSAGSTRASTRPGQTSATCPARTACPSPASR